MANETPSSVMGDNEYNILEQAIQRTKDNEEEIKKAIRAGVDVGTAMEDNRANLERLMKIKNAYYPGR